MQINDPERERVELLPCPCCASTRLDFGLGEPTPDSLVYCRDCGLRAINPARWNQRAALRPAEGLAEIVTRVRDESRHNEGPDYIRGFVNACNGILALAPHAIRSQGERALGPDGLPVDTPEERAAYKAGFADGAQGEREAWQPIETAPKENARLILSFNRYGVMDTICWNEAAGTWDDGLYDDPYDSSPPPCNPTHWMPLPSPPRGDHLGGK